jgi:hypothetical protein
MSASNKEFTLKKKPRIASGWAAYPSKSYPNKMYYFNVDSGSSSWDEPILKQFSGSDDVSNHTFERSMCIKSNPALPCSGFCHCGFYDDIMTICIRLY